MYNLQVIQVRTLTFVLNHSKSDADKSDTDGSLLEASCLPGTKLNRELECVLPADEYTYIVETFKKLPQHTFCGAPTEKQRSAQKNKKAKTMLSGVKCKKTQCKSTFKITILNPPKGKGQKYRNTHKAVVKLVFHPIESAHVLGFRPVAENTNIYPTIFFWSFCFICPPPL